MAAKDTKTRDRVAAARAGLVLDHPFFGHLSLQMKLVEDRSCDTAWSDGKVIGYNPLYARMLPPEKLKGLMAHLVMHPACRHHLRRNGRDPKLWNIACDYAINWILIEAGLTLPDGFLDDPKLRGKTADTIYARLDRERDGSRSDTKNHPSESQRPDDGEATDTPDDAGKPGHRNRSSDDDADTDENDGQDSSESASADDETRSDKEQQRFDQGDPGRSGEVRDAPPPESGSAETGEDADDESQWRIHLAQAASKARNMGDLPSGLARMVGHLLSPKLDWRQLLNRFIQAAARYDYAWTPPNRRYIHQGLYLPAMRSTDLPEVVVAVDTSGSVSPQELDQFAAELSAITETCAQTLYLLYCDARVARTEIVHRQDMPFSLTPVGGGGTDYRPAFDWVTEQGINPLCMIYLTDMACNRFPREPAYPVLWANIGDGDIDPPFGEFVAVR